MRFHLPALSGQPVTRANSTCAYTQKVLKFAQMMTDLGHEVIIYGGSKHDKDAPGQYVACYPKRDWDGSWDPKVWRKANLNAALAIEDRAEPGDFLCVISGLTQKTIADALPELPVVEYGIGYEGTFAPNRVFESYAWMHTVIGQDTGADSDGRFFDTVIPNYFNVQDFDLGAPEDREDYLLYMGRVHNRKGVHVAEQTAEELGIPLKIAGPKGDHTPKYGEVLGPVGPEERNELMGKAMALLTPTIYIEPFGGVAVEAMLCGTPVISTDWGAFTETVLSGVTGERCRTLGEFKEAVRLVGDLDPAAIREHAIANYSLEAIGPRYEAYFEQVETLQGKGWNSGWEGISRTQRYGTRRSDTPK